MTQLNSEITLKSGVKLKNRIAKAAMSENMAKNSLPESEFENTYSTWALGGLGLCITGNVMVDRNHLGEPNNVVLDEEVKELSSFKKWAKAGKLNNTSLYMQINHPGKQVPKMLSKNTVAPSAIPFAAPMGNLFSTPRELTQNEILDIIKKFGTSAQLAQEAGFDGVQIHGAHGYLVSQFLSANHNQRKDEWGGNLKNRMRFLLSIITEIKERTGPKFGLGLKLNSADFQKGGFTEEESMEVVKVIDKLGLDFIEISGGTYESTAMMGKNQKASTSKREAYFIEYARKICEFIETPLMVTGGFRNKKAAQSAVQSGNVDLVGFGRPFAVYPDLAKKLIQQSDYKIDITEKKTGFKTLDALFPLEITWYTQQIHRLGKKQTPLPKKNVWLSVFQTICKMGLSGLKKTRA